MTGLYYTCLFTLTITVACIHDNATLPAPYSHDRQRQNEPNSTSQMPPINCQLELKPRLQHVPRNMHKATPQNPPSPGHPLMAVGYHMWIGIECSCCCGPDRTQVLQAIIASEEITSGALATPAGHHHLTYQLQTNNSKVISLTSAGTDIDCLAGGAVGSSSDSRRRRLSLVREPANTRCENNVCRLNLPVECRQSQEETAEVAGVQSPAVEPSGFCISADHLGYANVLANLVWINVSSIASSSLGTTDNHTKREAGHGTETRRTVVIATGRLWDTLTADDNGTSANSSSSTTEALMVDHVRVTVVLPPQTFYVAADWSTAIITSMIAFSVGCCSEPVLLKAYLRLVKPILTGVVCQLIIIPVISLAIGACFSLNTNQAFGLFVTATVPGGGLGFLFTYLAKGDRHMSAALSLVNSFSDIVMASLWMLIVGRFWFQRALHPGIVAGWLAIVPAAQLSGIFVRSYQPGLANGLLTWVTRPLLLLWGILVVTLGVYINHYAYAELNRRLIASLLLLSIAGFVLAWVINRLLKQSVEKTKAMATEASIFNGLLCMPLLRTSLHSPDGDLAAVVALGATFLALIPLILNAVLTVLHRWLSEYLQRRRKLREQRHGSLLPGLMSTNSNIGDMCPTSVVAVAAAAIAVAPACVTGVRDTGHNETTRERVLQSSAANLCGSSSSYGGADRTVGRQTDSLTEDSTHSTVVTSDKDVMTTDRQGNTLSGTMIFTNTSIRVDSGTPEKSALCDDNNTNNKVSPTIDNQYLMDSGVTPSDWSRMRRYHWHANRKEDGRGDGATTRLLAKDTEKLQNHHSQSLIRLSGGKDDLIKASNRPPFGFWYDRIDTSPNRLEEISMMPITTSFSHYQMVIDDPLGPRTGTLHPAGGVGYQTREVNQLCGNKCMPMYPDATPYTNL